MKLRSVLARSAVLLSLAGAPLFSVAVETAPAAAPVQAKEPMLGLPETDERLPGKGPIRRADWFRKIWNERRSSWAKRVQQDQGALVFLGDSITQGWGDDLGGAFPGVKVANRGIGGDTTRGILVRLKEDVIALHPKGVVLLAGTNDLEEGAEAEVIANNIKLIVKALEKSDRKMPIIVCQVFPSSPEKYRAPYKIKDLNTALAQALQKNPRVTLVQTWSVFAGPDGNATADEFPDLLHPNKIGYTKWAAVLHPVLAQQGLLKK